MLSTIGSPQQFHERLLVELSGVPMSRFEVIDAVRDGATLVLQCEPREHEGSAESSFHSAEPSGRFAVTEVVQDGTSLVLQCQPKKTENDDAPRSRQDDPNPRQDDPNRVFYPNKRCEGLSHHDPRLFYEDLR